MTVPCGRRKATASWLAADADKAGGASGLVCLSAIPFSGFGYLNQAPVRTKPPADGVKAISLRNAIRPRVAPIWMYRTSS